MATCPGALRLPWPPTTHVVVAILDLTAFPWIEDLRREYDPLAEKVAAHLMLVHPFRNHRPNEELFQQIADVCRAARPIWLKPRPSNRRLAAAW